MAADIWLPASIVVTNTGSLAHSLPFPSPAATGGTGLGPAADFSAIGAGFFPVVGGNYSNVSRLYALTNDKEELSTFFPGPDGFLIPQHPDSGYRYLKSENGSLTLGAGVSIGPAGWAILNITFTVAGTYSQGYSSNRFVPNKKSIGSLKRVKIPATKEDILSLWSPGDSLDTSRSATASFNVSAGAGALAVGAGVSFTGNWGVSIMFEGQSSPKREPIVRVTYTKGDSQEIQANANALVAGVSIAKIFGKSNSVSYRFNLNNTKTHDLTVKKDKNSALTKTFTNASVEMLYQLALHGNFILADMVASQKDSYKRFGVEKLEVVDTQEQKVQQSAFITIPILFSASNIQGKSVTMSNSKMLSENTIAESIVGIYSREFKTSGAASRDRGRSELFSGNFQEIRPLNYKSFKKRRAVRRYSGNYKYLFIGNKIKGEDVVKELEKIRYKIGMMKSLKGQLGFENMESTTLGSVNLELDVLLSNKATDELMNIAGKFSQKDLEYEVTQYVKGFFKNVTDAADEVRCKIKLGCESRTLEKSLKGIRKIHQSLLNMKKFKSDKDYKSFVSSYSEFGRAFLKNRFIFKTVLRLLRYSCLPSIYMDLQNITDENKLNQVCPNKAANFPYEIKFKFKSSNYKPREFTIFSSVQDAKMNGHKIFQ